MTRQLTRSAFRLLSLILTFLIAIGGFTILKSQGWLTPLGIESKSHDSQVIRAIERTQEVALLKLGIQGIKEKDHSAKVFGQSIPGTSEKAFVEYTFNAKLGLDGAQVKITKTGENAYLLSVPDFKFIGYDKLHFRVAAEDGGVLSWVTPDVDKLEMANEILGPAAQREYVTSNEELLKEQAQAFYNGLITSIDPELVTRFEFRS